MRKVVFIRLYPNFRQPEKIFLKYFKINQHEKTGNFGNRRHFERVCHIITQR
ncbi:hypothetical protein [Wielerella bovis]|uniref:hypothetical protein n=1 Tax=Wielerella bovis TaxID=2917790 RepID=UPI002018AC40|nr:hypothetical protein [Wielerella bovis]ULJ61333.1 hypothetical protein MIS44_05690 [Wielerella bovis]